MACGRITALASPCGMPVRPPSSCASPWCTPIDAFCRHRPPSTAPASIPVRASTSAGSSTTAGRAAAMRADAGQGDGLGLGCAPR